MAYLVCFSLSLLIFKGVVADRNTDSIAATLVEVKRSSYLMSGDKDTSDSSESEMSLSDEALVNAKVAFFTSAETGQLLLKGVAKNITDDNLMSKIKDIKKHSGGGGMMPEEYFTFMSYVRDHAPQNLLVWGIGYDSRLLNALNEGGKTIFLEPNAEWVERTDAKDLNYVSYLDKSLGTSVGTYHEFLAHPHRANLPVLNQAACWDTVLVDSPNGWLDEHVGRAVPLYTAKEDLQACRANKKYPSAHDVSVFVHDCDRDLENDVTAAFFGAPKREVGPKKLRQFVM